MTLLTDLWAALIALWSGLDDLGRAVFIPTMLYKLPVALLTIVSVYFAVLTRHHPDVLLRWAARFVALTLILQYPARSHDPAAFGRMWGAWALLLLMVVLCRRATWRTQKELHGFPHPDRRASRAAQRFPEQSAQQ